MPYVFDDVPGEESSLMFKFNGQFALKNYNVTITQGNRLKVTSAQDELFSLLEVDVTEIEINGMIYSDASAAQVALQSLVYSDAAPRLMTALEKATIMAGYKGSIKKSTATPTQIGFYLAEEQGIYPNINNLEVLEGFLTFFAFNGTTWSKSEIKAQAGGNTVVEIPFSTFIKFEKERSISKTILSAAANFTFVSTNAKFNAIETKEVITNGYPLTFVGFTTKIQSDIDYSKPVTIVFHRPLTPSLKPLALVINGSDIDTSVPLSKFKVNTAGGATINTWFESFEFLNHTVTANDCVYNIGIFNYQGVNYLTGNFTTVGQGAAGRWANFSIPESQWLAGKIFDPDGGSISGVRIKMGSIKPTSLIQANTADYTLIQI